MSKRYLELFAVDILIAIDRIERYRVGYQTAQDFYHDEKSFDATMRELQIIGEATRHLLAMEWVESDYRIVVDFRNVIVHEYFGINADEIWDILQHELPPFRDSIMQKLQQLDPETTREIIDDLLGSEREETVRFLVRLKKQLQ
jgi:uncharacterized protein with HEPN domain